MNDLEMLLNARGLRKSYVRAGAREDWAGSGFLRWTTWI
jgi:hypothetical protein